MHSPRILIVEDERIVARGLALSLSSAGYRIVGTVTTGEEAIQQAGEFLPDLVLMDILLEGDMDGIEAADQIRALHDIPIVYITAQSDGPFMDRIRASQPYGYLTKPVLLSQLHATIETAIYKHSIETELRQSEEKYRMLFSKEKDAILLVDAQSWTVLDANEAAQQLYGYSKEEFLDLKLGDLSAEPEKTEEAFRSCDERSGLFVPLRWQKKRDGTALPTEISAGTFTWNGRPVVCAIMRDISERIWSQSLVLAQRDLSNALSGTSDLKEALELCVDASLRISGMDAGAVFLINDDLSLSLAFHKGLPDEFAAKLAHVPPSSPLALLVFEGSSFCYNSEQDHEIFDSEKHVEGFRVVAVIPFSCEGRTVGCINIASRELEEVPTRIFQGLEILGGQIGCAIARIQAQDAARESERFLSNIFDSMQDGISVLDTNLNIVRVNSVMERWLAHAMPLVGKKCYEAFHRADEPCPVCPVRETCKAAQPAYQLIPVKGPYNQVLGWLDLYTFPVFDPESGKLTRVIEYVRNATDRKRAEDQPLQE